VNSQQLLYINIFLGLLFLVYFVFGRSQPKAPTRLNLKNKDTVPESPVLDKNIKPDTLLTSKMTVLEPELKINIVVETQSSQKELAIFFIYNGHDWEAYNVLGVAQGANLKTVTDAYQKLLAKGDVQSYNFIESAYTAILQKNKKRTDRL
jgi:hypothetical protein